MTCKWPKPFALRPSNRPKLHLKALALPGTAAGLLWCSGNFFQTAAVVRGGNAAWILGRRPWDFFESFFFDPFFFVCREKTQFYWGGDASCQSSDSVSDLWGLRSPLLPRGLVATRWRHVTEKRFKVRCGVCFRCPICGAPSCGAC